MCAAPFGPSRQLTPDPLTTRQSLHPLTPGCCKVSPMSKKPALAAFCRFDLNSDFQNLLDALSEKPKFVERRCGTRIAKKLVLSVQPLDDSFQPIGEPFSATTRDFSSGGIGFSHHDLFPTRYVRVSPIAGSHSIAIAEVRYHHPCPDAGGYLIGVKFLAGE